MSTIYMTEESNKQKKTPVRQGMYVCQSCYGNKAVAMVIKHQ